MEKRERLLLIALGAASLVLRAMAFFRYRFDSDEQQHLHVSWGWTAGLVQYRDLFDNHTPLFHMLTAPIVALLGERSDILLWMRAPMLLLFAVVLWATYVLARDLYDRRVALWAVVLLSLFPPFFLKSLEFRNDNLWTAFSLLAMVALVRQMRPFLIGLILGAALAVSIKALFLTGALLVAGVITRLFAVRFNSPQTANSQLPTTVRVAMRDLAAALAGFAIIPAALTAYFIAIGAGNDLAYGTITFNLTLAQTRSHLWIARALFPGTFAAVVWLVWRFRGTTSVWRSFFAVTIGIFTVTLASFGLLISPRDFLPLMPLGAMFAAASLTRMRRPLRALAIVAIVFIGALWYYADRFENNTNWHITMMDQALRLSHPGETVMDLKGETIYRRRPYFYAFEVVTRAQLAYGLIADTVPEDVIRTRTHVAQADGPMWPPGARAFLSENFLDMGRLRASGQWIHADGTFTIAVPGEYVIVDERGEARGALDGSAYSGARELAPGTHRFGGTGERVAVVWAPAVRRGHSPFHLRDREF